MTDNIVMALNQIHDYFEQFDEKSTDEQINEGVLIVNFIGLLSSNFVKDVIKPRLQERLKKDIIVDTGATA